MIGWTLEPGARKKRQAFMQTPEPQKNLHILKRGDPDNLDRNNFQTKDLGRISQANLARFGYASLIRRLLGRNRSRPQGQILFAYQIGPRPIAGGAGELEPPLRRYQQRGPRRLRS